MAMNFQSLTSNPGYVEATFEQQAKYRQEWVKEELMKSPSFQRLDPKIKQSLVFQALTDAPKFKNPQFGQYAQDLIQRSEQGDKEASDRIEMMVTHQVAKTSGLIYSLANKLLLSSFADVVSNKEGEVWTGAHREEVKNPEDFAKMTSYFSDYMDAKGSKTGWMTAVSMASALTDFATIGLNVGTGVESARGAGMLAKFVQQSIAKGSKSGGMVLASLVGETVHAGITASLGVVREFALEEMNTQIKINKDFQTIVKKTGRWFGQYFAGDLVVNWAAGVVWPMAKLGLFKGGIGKGYGNVSKVWKVTPEEFAELNFKIFAGETISEDQLLHLPKEMQRHVLSSRATFQVAKHVERLTDEGAMQLVTHTNGFNMLKHADEGWEISLKFGKGKPFIAKNLKEINDYMIKQKGEMNPLFKIKDPKVFAKQAAGAPEVEVKSIIQATLSPKESSNINILTRLAAPTDGKFTKTKLEAFAKTYIKGNGSPDGVIKSVNVIKKGDMFEVYAKKKLIAEVPIKQLLPDEEVEIIKALTKSLSEVSGAKGFVPVGEKFISKYVTSLVDQKIFTPEWMAYSVDLGGGKLVQDKNLWKILSKSTGKVMETFDSLSDVGEALIRKNVSVDMLRLSAIDQGLKLTHNIQKETYKIFDGKLLLAEGKSLDEILNRMPSLLPKVSSDLGPKVTVIKNTGELGVRFTQEGIAIAKYQNIFKFLDKFKKHKYAPTRISLTGGAKGRIEFVKKSKQFEVVIPDIGERMIFNKIGEARKYLEGGWKEMDNIKYSANIKGYRMEYRVGKWLLYNDDGTQLAFDNFEQMTKALKNVPTPEWAPELSGIPEELLEGFKRPEHSLFLVKQPVIPEGSALDYGIHARASTMYLPIQSNLELLVKKGGNPIALELFHKTESLRTFMEGREDEMKKLFLTVFDKGGGKVFNKKTRFWIGEYKKALNPQQQEKVVSDALFTDKIKLGRQELEAAEKLRTVYESLAPYFDVDPKLILDGYLPRIAIDVKQNTGRVFSEGKIGTYLKDVYKNKVPKEMDAFFQHARTSEAIGMAVEADPLAQLLRYSHVGLKEKYLGNIIEEIKKSPILAKDPVMQERLFTYIREIGGLPSGHAQEVIRQITPKILKKIGVDTSLTNDIVKWFMTLGYGASMGYKGFLPVRNMNQIFTMLAPRMGGNHWVKQALKEVAGPRGGEIFNTLRKKGVIMSSLPLFGSEIVDQTSLLGKLTHTGLKWYKNSDDFTRAVAYVASDLKFQDAFGKIQSLNLKGDEFLHLSGVSTMEPVLRKNIIELIDAGNSRGAKDLFATQITKETMFPYKAGMAPQLYSGTIGKMFGMMGHYSAYYIDNIRRSINYMTTGEKLIAGGVFAANSTFLYGAFRAIGVNARAFLPWEPAMFTGGPSWEILHDMLSAASFGAEGKASRALLFGLSNKGGKLSFNPLNSTFFKWTFPGAFEIRKIRDAVDLANEGNSWGAFLSLTGSPLDPEWEFPDL